MCAGCSTGGIIGKLCNICSRQARGYYYKKSPRCSMQCLMKDEDMRTLTMFEKADLEAKRAAWRAMIRYLNGGPNSALALELSQMKADYSKAMIDAMFDAYHAHLQNSAQVG
jgi:hypothetical protein